MALALRASTRWRLGATALTIVGLSAAGTAQTLSKLDRDRAHQMLTTIKGEIKKKYYDPSFRGIDLEARFKVSDEKLGSATSLGQAFAIIAQTLLDFDDSHTFFVPPNRTNRVAYGWQMQMVADDCFVVAVNPRSDAAAKGLKA